MNPVNQIFRATRPIYRKLSTSVPLAAPKPIPTTGFCFELNDEQKALQDLARKFTKEEIIPAAAHYDKTGEYPWPIVKKAWEVGLMNGHVPEHCGGNELNVFESCIITEELAYGCCGVKAAILTSNIGNYDAKSPFIPNTHGGIGNFGIFDECLIAEEFAYGCTGITTAVGASTLGVSDLLTNITTPNDYDNTADNSQNNC